MAHPTSYKSLSIQTPANGRLRKSTVVVRGENDEVLFTDSADLASAAERTKVSKRAARQLNVEVERIAAELETAWNDVANQYDRIRAEEAEPTADSPPPQSSPATEANTSDTLLAAMPQGIVDDAKAMLRDPELIRRIVDDIELFGVAGERQLTAIVYLVGVSRLLPRPLSAIVQGPSSSGKSYLVEKVAQAFPPEAILIATQMTPQALFHMRPGSLCHRWIVGGERSRLESDDRAEATRALREMQSSGRLSKMMPVKVPGGAIETMLLEQEGPIAFIETTTLTQIFDEDENRCLLLHTDERAEQTRRIIDKTATGYQAALSPAAAHRRLVHHALQRMLLRYPVRVPFAGELGDRFPCDRVEARRAFAHVLNLVQASALLHQYQRTVADDGYLLADVVDYQIARHLLAKPLARLLGDTVSDPARRFYESLAARWPCPTGDDSVFTINEARKVHRASKSAVRGWLAELLEAGAVQIMEEGRGRKPSRWQMTGTAPADQATLLPTVEDLFGPEGCARAHKPED